VRYTVEATTPLRRHCEAEDLAEQAEALESGLPSRPASTERRIPAGRDPSGRAVGTTMPSRRHSGANINRRMFKPYPQARRAMGPLAISRRSSGRMFKPYPLALRAGREHGPDQTHPVGTTKPSRRHNALPVVSRSQCHPAGTESRQPR